MSDRRASLVAVLLAGTACTHAATAAREISIAEVGRYNFSGGGAEDPRLSAEELSGFARMRDGRYVAVGDDHAGLNFLDIAVDAGSGRVRSAIFPRAIPLRDPDGRELGQGHAADREDVAIDPRRGTLWIADERDDGDRARPSLIEVDPKSGRILRRLSPADGGPLAVYATARPNYGFEAVACSPTGVLWTANEEALSIDGPLASPAEGTVVRLLELDEDRGTARQFAYVTDPTGFPIRSPEPAVGEDRSGVSALLALADGRLLVLERALAGDSTGMAGFRIRIFLADAAGATDVSVAPFVDGLAGTSGWTPVSKTLLFERRFGLPVSNFEGMAIGPRLGDGDRSLLLLADNGGGSWQSIYALRLRGAP